MTRFLIVGCNCADWVLFLPKFVLEDTEQRCTNQSWVRGGNASNSASVLAILGADVEYFGTLADDHMKKFFMDDMTSYGIKHSNCPVLLSYHGGTSVVICSEETGSRTIIHSKGTLPELTYEQFKQNINLDDYKWIHFELEKRIETISVLLPFADVAFIGKDYAMMKGASDCIQAAEIMSQQITKGTLLICPWGEQGAALCVAGDSLDKIIKVDASPPEKIIDSLGAGDTFNAAVIYALGKNESPEDSVKFGCKVAGAKLSRMGFCEISISSFK